MESNLFTNTAMLISLVREDVGGVEGYEQSDNNLHYGQDHFPFLELFKDRHFSRLIINPVHALGVTSKIDLCITVSASIAQVSSTRKFLIQIWLAGDHCWRIA